MFGRRKPAVASTFTPRQKPVRWVLRTSDRVRVFTSLSQMASSLSSDPVPDDEWVSFERNGDMLFIGYWNDRPRLDG